MEPVELHLLVGSLHGRRGSIARHIYAQIRKAIIAGSLGDGVLLPSSRHAAGTLAVSRNTLNTAYDLLRAEGLLDIPSNRRPRVAAPRNIELPVDVARVAAPAPRPLVGRLVRNYRQIPVSDRTGAFAPGCPDHALFPSDAWGRALRRAARRPYSSDRTLSEIGGLADLREALAVHLARERGLSARPEQILITAGTQASLALLANAVGGPGSTAWSEDPSYLGAVAALEGAGMTVRRTVLDGEGAMVPACDRSEDVRLIYLTPSNQYPTGCRMTLGRRLEFIGHARALGALIIEDDYDTEFQWRGGVIPAMHALGDDTVVYLGTTSKSLMIGMQLGWMVVPQDLAKPLAQALANMGMSANVHAQAALADFIASGEYAIQVRRISRIYAERGERLAAALKASLGNRIILRPPDGGLQLSAIFPPPFDEDAALEALREAGFTPGRLSSYSARQERIGLVIGFADASPDLIERFCEILAGCISR